MNLRAGDLVRLIGNRAGRHAKPAVVKSVSADQVLVVPFGHKQSEWVDARHVKPWKSKNAARKRNDL